jgi:NAD(P)H-hydrate epimerase
MKLVTAQEMQEIDRRTIEGGHVDSLALMERAGAAVADAVLEILQDVEMPQVEIVCGKGNNGGDGLVVGRLLAASDINVRVWLAQSEALSSDAQRNLQRLRQSQCIIAEIPRELEAPADPKRRLSVRGTRDRPGTSPNDALLEFHEALLAADLCVDALLGTGIQKEVTGRYAAILSIMNACCAHILAVDVPSGVDATTGEVRGVSCWADHTITMGLPKRGLVFHPGAARTGKLQVADLGFPPAILDAIETPWVWMDAQRVQHTVPLHDPTTHKYQRGALLLIAGSRAYPGAAALAAEAALRSGAGLVHLVVPRCISDLVNGQLREAIVHAAPETESGSLHTDAFELVTRLLSNVRAMAIGPGMSDNAVTQQLITRILTSVQLPHVVDADALVPSIEAPVQGPRVLTPHVGELLQMLRRTNDQPTSDQLTTASVATDRVALAAQVAKAQGCTVLCKGAPSVVVLADGRRIVNSTGNIGLATAGSGDVLTGLLGGLLAQGVAAEDAAPVAAYLHGRAAEILGSGFASRSLVAGDLLQGIGLALGEFTAN